jgi:hypothetical protein
VQSLDCMVDVAEQSAWIPQWFPLSGCCYGAWHCCSEGKFISSLTSVLQFVSTASALSPCSKYNWSCVPIPGYPQG